MEEEVGREEGRAWVEGGRLGDGGGIRGWQEEGEDKEGNDGRDENKTITYNNKNNIQK